jgi:hypothetical protein
MNANQSEVNHILSLLGEGLDIVSIVVLVLEEFLVLGNVVIHMP